MIRLLLALPFLVSCTEYKSTSSSSSLSSACVGSECAMVASRFKTTNGLLKQSQAMSALQTCLQLPDSAISAETKKTYSTVRLSLSAEGILTDINGPMMMALTQLAGDMCHDRINYETTGTSMFFPVFDIKTSGGSGSGNVVLEDSINKLAKACWGRDPMAFETQKIKDLFEKSSFAARRDKGAALFLCTLVLSASDVLIY